MSVAFFIVAEREVEGLDTLVDGKALAHCRDLDRIAERAGVRPLMSYFCESSMPADFGLDSEEDELPAEEIAPAQWFEAQEGLVTVRALLSLMKDDASRAAPEPSSEPKVATRRRAKWTPKPSAIIEDLEQFEEVLSRLAAAKVRWHLAIDT